MRHPRQVLIRCARAPPAAARHPRIRVRLRPGLLLAAAAGGAPLLGLGLRARPEAGGVGEQRELGRREQRQVRSADADLGFGRIVVS